ncbi:hypothetical protein Arnit_0768 [Arcobacter nitrofigilis DSM 7299]|uniref:Uncharacterized protein n=1 Tax=Arcobacter nitrofigilis (strain ATCC 33309 / DSM 7299 / CCUG 15893 / LMG 7604 / NCTC 12251 / CI) TaxID=572480 RepID=D5V2K0_ARCNC|nr:hypothetical protein Arnit_0768 [Arcobacter nitrofigilis DSM 7299]
MFTQEVTLFTIFTTIAVILVIMAIGIFLVKNKKIED